MILDSGFFISLDRNEKRSKDFLVACATKNVDLYTTEAVVAQVWRSSSQVLLAKLLKNLTDIFPLIEGKLIGSLLANSNTTDVVDAHLAITAIRIGKPILTSDTDDISLISTANNLGLDIYPW